MSTARSIDSAYANNPAAMVTALLTFRIHPGLAPENDMIIDNKKVVFNTRGLDIFVTVIRCLLGYGFEVESSLPSTSFEEDLLHLATLDIGYQKLEDLAAKQKSYDHIKKDQLVGLPFRVLMWDQRLSRIFSHNDQFELRDHRGTFVETGKNAWRFRPATSDTEKWTRIDYDGTMGLTEHIAQMTSIQEQGEQKEMPLCRRPEYLHIRYYNKTAGNHSISNLRIIKVDAWEAQQGNDGWKIGRLATTYQLLVVVRCAHNPDIDHERIRVYSPSGEEWMPSEVGDFENKEPIKDATPWTIEDKGIYSMFYFLVEGESDQGLEDYIRGQAEYITNRPGFERFSGRNSNNVQN